MDLNESYRFQGWHIRYRLASPTSAPTTGPSSVKNVVFVHGTPWSSAVFQPVVEALLAKGSYRILVYDLPGYGESQGYEPMPGAASRNGFSGDTSVKFQAYALSALLKHARLDGNEGQPVPAVIAHDIAGAIVLRAHLLEGCEFDSMMLVDTNAVLPWGDGFFKLVRSEPQPFLRLPPKIFEAMVRAVIRSACHNPKILQAGWEDRLARYWTESPSDAAEPADGQRNFIRQIAQANDADVAEMLEGNMYAGARCDVKIVWGEQDQWIPREKVEELIMRLNGKVKERAFIPEAGHLVMLDQPARFAIEVFDWLTRFGSARGLDTF